MEIYYNKIMLENFNTSFSSMDKSSSKKIQERNISVSLYYRSSGLHRYLQTFHPTDAEYTFCPTAYEISKIEHILTLKASLNKFKNTEVIPCLFSDYN